MSPVGIEHTTPTITGFKFNANPALPVCHSLLVSDCQTLIKSYSIESRNNQRSEMEHGAIPTDWRQGFFLLKLFEPLDAKRKGSIFLQVHMCLPIWGKGHQKHSFLKWATH